MKSNQSTPPHVQFVAWSAILLILLRGEPLFSADRDPRNSSAIVGPGVGSGAHERRAEWLPRRSVSRLRSAQFVSIIGAISFFPTKGPPWDSVQDSHIGDEIRSFPERKKSAKKSHFCVDFVVPMSQTLVFFG